MKRRSFLAGSIFAGAIATMPGCALIFDGGKGPDERDHGRILWGYLILDILFTGLLGLVIDFATGAIYARKGRRVATGSVHAVELCPVGHAGIVSAARPRRAARFIARHLPECTHCSLALADLQGPEVAVSEICDGQGEAIEEPFVTAFADDASCPA